MTGRRDPLPDGIFEIPARRCRRCGGLLTSEEALRDGYGHVCKKRMEEEEAARRADENQYSLWEV